MRHIIQKSFFAAFIVVGIINTMLFDAGTARATPAAKAYPDHSGYAFVKNPEVALNPDEKSLRIRLPQVKFIHDHEHRAIFSLSPAAIAEKLKKLSHVILVPDVESAAGMIPQQYKAAIASITNEALTLKFSNALPQHILPGNLLLMMHPEKDPAGFDFWITAKSGKLSQNTDGRFVMHLHHPQESSLFESGDAQVPVRHPVTENDLVENWAKGRDFSKNPPAAFVYGVGENKEGPLFMVIKNATKDPKNRDIILEMIPLTLQTEKNKMLPQPALTKLYAVKNLGNVVVLVDVYSPGGRNSWGG